MYIWPRGWARSLSSGIQVVSLGWGQLVRADRKRRGAANLCDANGLARRNIAAVAGHRNLSRGFRWCCIRDAEMLRCCDCSRPQDGMSMALVEAALFVTRHPAHRILPKTLDGRGAQARQGAVLPAMAAHDHSCPTKLLQPRGSQTCAVARSIMLTRQASALHDLSIATSRP